MRRLVTILALLVGAWLMLATGLALAQDDGEKPVTVTTDADGVKTSVYASGMAIREYPAEYSPDPAKAGLSETTYPDNYSDPEKAGTTVIGYPANHPDKTKAGTTVVTFPGNHPLRPGQTEVQEPDGTAVVSMPNGTKVTHSTDGAITFEFNDGTATRLYPDGATVQRHEDGTITVTKKDGTTETRFSNEAVGITDIYGRAKIRYSDGTKTVLDLGNLLGIVYPSGTTQSVSPSPGTAILPAPASCPANGPGTLFIPSTCPWNDANQYSGWMSITHDYDYLTETGRIVSGMRGCSYDCCITALCTVPTSPYSSPFGPYGSWSYSGYPTYGYSPYSYPSYGYSAYGSYPPYGYPSGGYGSYWGYTPYGYPPITPYSQYGLSPYSSLQTPYGTGGFGYGGGWSMLYGGYGASLYSPFGFSSTLNVWGTTGALQSRLPTPPFESPRQDQPEAIELAHEDMAAAAINPGGTRAITLGRDGSVKLWDLTRLTELHTFQAHEASAWWTVFSPTGMVVATAGSDDPNLPPPGAPDTVKLWDVATGELLRALTGPEGVWSLAFSPDGTLLAAGGMLSDIWVWDVGSGAVVAQLSHNPAVTNDMVESLVFSADGAHLAASSYGVVQVYDTATWQPVFSRSDLGPVRRLVYSVDGGLLIAAGDSGVYLLDAATGATLRTLIELGDDELLFDMSLSPDGRLLTTLVAQVDADYNVVDETLTFWTATEMGEVGDPVPDPPAEVWVPGEGGTLAAPADTPPTGQPVEAPAGACTVSAGASVNMRGGPGTTYDVVGTLAAGQSSDADGQATGADGFVWWHLVLESWVRSDVVTAVGACDQLPVIQP